MGLKNIITKEAAEFGANARKRGQVRNVYLDTKARKCYDEVPEHAKEQFRMAWTKGWNTENSNVESMSKFKQPELQD